MSKWHDGPTYQNISPSGLAGLLLVLFVVFGFATILGLENLPALLIFYGTSIALLILVRIVVVKVIRVRAGRHSLLYKTDEQLERLDEEPQSEQEDTN